MPSFVQSFKLAADRGMNSRALWWLIFAVIIVGMAVSQHMNVLHPLGYAVAVSYPMFVFWLSAFIAWACKTLVTRFGGTDAARRLNAFFLGLVFGEVAMMLVWLIVDAWQGRTSHQLMP